MKLGGSILLALVAGLFIWLASGAVGPQHQAVAQGCGTSACSTPPTRCGGCQVTPPPVDNCNCTRPPPTTNCCAPNHNIYVPGVNVYVAPSVNVNANVEANVNVNANAGAQASARAGASALSVGIANSGSCCGGPAPTFFTPPMATGYIQGLVVEGPQATRRVAYEASRKVTRRVIIQAFCLDDKDVPHPASQVSPDREIGDYEGEIYRCIAGARMQYVVAEWKGGSTQINCGGPAGEAGIAGGAGLAGGRGGAGGGYAGGAGMSCAGLFNGGQTTVCNKSDALYYTPGGPGAGPGGAGGGTLSCRPQKPARDCNERSLLRRFGAGVKILTLFSEERYTAYREEVVQASSSVVTSLALDGGVGGVAF